VKHYIVDRHKFVVLEYISLRRFVWEGGEIFCRVLLDLFGPHVELEERD